MSYHVEYHPTYRMFGIFLSSKRQLTDGVLSNLSDFLKILKHCMWSNANLNFRLDSCHTADGRSPLHLVAEQNNGALWDIAVQRKDCDLNATDADGNTPLMRAVICGSIKILEAWLKTKENAQKVDQTLANKEGKTLLMLYVQYMNHIHLRALLNTIGQVIH